MTSLERMAERQSGAIPQKVLEPVQKKPIPKWTGGFDQEERALKKYNKATGPPKLKKSGGGNPNHSPKTGKFTSGSGGSKASAIKTPTGKKMTKEHYAAMAPTSSWSESKRTEIISKLGETEQGKALGEVLDRFQDGGSIARIRGDVATKLSGGELPEARAKKADAIITSLRDVPSSLSGPASKKYYRGMAVKGSADKLLAQYQEGNIDLNLTSFTSDRGIATQFQQRLAGTGKTRVMVELVGDNKKLLPIQNLAKDRRLFKEKEWVGGGKFKVVAAKKSSDGGVLLRIEQVGTL